MFQVPLDHDRRWRDLQELGLLPNVKNIEQYTSLVTQGLIKAGLYLQEFNPVVDLQPKHYRALHRFSFGGVHPWAGTFREKAIHIGGYPGADPLQIRPELNLLQLQFGYMLRKEPFAVALAFHHIRFERIHPFRDGNGRIGRLVLQEQTKHVFGIEPTWEDRDYYLEAVSEAQHGNLTPFANYLLNAIGEPLIKEPFKAPFRLAPQFFEGIQAKSPQALTLDDSFI